jgi:hypothetical protein
MRAALLSAGALHFGDDLPPARKARKSGGSVRERSGKEKIDRNPERHRRWRT